MVRQQAGWGVLKVSADFVAPMEDGLDLYGEPYDAKRPVVWGSQRFATVASFLLLSPPWSGRRPIKTKESFEEWNKYFSVPA